MTPMIQVDNLKKYFDDFILGSLSFEVAGGGVVGLFGPNGAGKTTLLKLLAKQIPADQGVVKILGYTYPESEKTIKNLIGYVPQEPCFYWDKSVSWTARFVSRFYDHWERDRFHQFLEHFRLNPRQKTKNLSRGQKTLLSIAIALSHRAKLLILDEPTAGLDMILRRDLLAHIRKFSSQEGCSTIIASHFTDGLDDICDYVKFMSRGKLVLEESKDDLLDRWKWIHFKEGALSPALQERLLGLEKHPFHHSGLTPDYGNLHGELGAGLASGDIRIENASLDDILIALLKGENNDWPA